MRSIRESIDRLVSTVRPRRTDEELAEELRLHAELAGEQGRRAAGASQAMDVLRDQRGLPWLDDLVRDVRHAFRSLRRAPGFTVVALVILAVGVGVNTAIFTLLNGVLLSPLSYPTPSQLVYLTAEYQNTRSADNALSVREYLEFRQLTGSFSAIGAYRVVGGVYTTGEVNLSVGDRPVRARSLSVDADLLDVLDLRPVQGRAFTRAETDLGTDRSLESPQAMVSHELWQTTFGGAPLVGQTVRIDGRPFEIIGIMPPGADVMDNRTDVWLPLGLPRGITQSRVSHILRVVGRLKDGVTEEQARAELDAFLANWSERTGAAGHVPIRHPGNPRQHGLRLEPLQDVIVGAARRPLWVLQIAAGLVLLIACGNLANLVLARAEVRRGEFAVRAALGAGRGRLLRQVITEGLVLSWAGGGLGIVLAIWSVTGLLGLYGDNVPRAADLGVDTRVLLFAVITSLATGVVFGVAPALQRRFVERTAVRHYLRRGLVVAQVALTVALVTGASLLIRTVFNLTAVDVGFDRQNLVTFEITLPEPYDPDTRLLAYQRLLSGLQSAPGVERASIMSGLPLHRSPEAVATRIEGHVGVEGTPIEVVDYYQSVIGDYFGTMGIPIVAGRGFEPADTATQRRVVVVNETLAGRVWRDRSPIGQQLRPNLGQALGRGGDPGLFTVIGVAKDITQDTPDTAAGAELYVPLEPLLFAAPTMNVVMRTTASPAALVEPIARIVRAVDSSVPVVRLRTMDEVMADAIRRPRLLAQLLGAFAGLALLLASVGTYGLLAFLVAERRRDMGIRLALGAPRSGLVALVMRQGLQLVVAGLVVGLVASAAASPVISALLFGVAPSDAATIAAVVVTVGMAAVFACWLPAWRASRVDPVVVLRAE